MLVASGFFHVSTPGTRSSAAMDAAPLAAGSDPVWVVAAIVAERVVLPTGETLPRADFFEAVWELLDGTGLAGIHEGTIDVGEAYAAGLVESPLVIDAAAAPERDWVADRALVDAEFWFGDEAGARGAAARLVRCVGCAVAEIRRVEPRDWVAAAHAAHAPVVIPGFGTVLAPWHTERSGGEGTRLVVDPGTGFGTGSHPTTRLCLEAIAALPPGEAPARTVLDVGAGSGILGIAAALRGAVSVTAVEIDVRVHDAIRRNAALNDVGDRLTVATSLDDVTAAHDLVMANIVGPVLVAMARPLVARGRPGGTIVLGGLRDLDLAEVRAVYRSAGAEEVASRESEGWSCLTFRIAAGPPAAESCRSSASVSALATRSTATSGTAASANR